MAKKKVEVVDEKVEQPVENVETVKEVDKTTAKKVKESDKKSDKKVKKEKKPGLKTKMKATTSELKKVTWPAFGKAIKKTGIVLGFVAVAGLLLLGIDRLLSLIYTFLIR